MQNAGREQWLTSEIPVTWEVEMRRIKVQGQPRQNKIIKNYRDPISINKPVWQFMPMVPAM
jgi:hypothetical protein